MSDRYGSRFGRPMPEPEDLETILARALRAEAERIHPVGDGLVKIRARAQGRRSVLAWFAGSAARPVLAGGTLVLTLVAGTMIGRQLTDRGNETEFADGPRSPIAGQPFGSAPPLIPNDQADAERVNPTPVPATGPEGGNLPTVDTAVTEAPADSVRIAPVTPDQERSQSDNGIPVDRGGNYIAILAPLSGGTYDSPLTLYGKARVYEAQVTIDISQNGTVLQRARVIATEAGPALGEWHATIALAPGNYRVDAYALSPEDGEERLTSDSIWITVRTDSTATSTPSPSPSSTPSATPTASPAPTPGASSRPS